MTHLLILASAILLLAFFAALLLSLDWLLDKRWPLADVRARAKAAERQAADS
ncbi:MAG: hypothetical protein AAGD38_04320 [Acidobacteriota bacterium]